MSKPTLPLARLNALTARRKYWADIAYTLRETAQVRTGRIELFNAQFNKILAIQADHDEPSLRLQLFALLQLYADRRVEEITAELKSYGVEEVQEVVDHPLPPPPNS